MTQEQRKWPMQHSSILTSAKVCVYIYVGGKVGGKMARIGVHVREEGGVGRNGRQRRSAGDYVENYRRAYEFEFADLRELECVS